MANLKGHVDMVQAPKRQSLLIHPHMDRHTCGFHQLLVARLRAGPSRLRSVIFRNPSGYALEITVGDKTRPRQGQTVPLDLLPASTHSFLPPLSLVYTGQ